MKLAGIICILSIIAMIAFPTFIWATMKLPADIQYSNLFGSIEEQVYDSASLENMRDNFILLWQQTNSTFAGMDWNHTYNTWWMGDQVKINSLAYQNNYYSGLKQLIDNKIAIKNDFVGNGTQRYVIDDWEAKAINQTRIEMKRSGGLCWVTDGTWYLTFASAAYWSFWYMVAVFVIFLIIALISGAIALE